MSQSDKEKPVSGHWYGVRPLDNDILWVREVFVNNFAVGDSWLVRGSKMDLVVDTCSGIVPLAPVIESISGKPVLAIAMNSSYDHCGGWSGFENRACHKLDAAGLADPQVTQQSVFDYLNDDMLYALPYANYSTRYYAMTGADPTRLLGDGEIIDIGNRQLKVMHTPGRGKGGICLWESDSGSLFTSDMLYDGEHGKAWPPELPDEYVTSLERLSKLPVSTVFPGHYGTFDRKRLQAIVKQQITGLEG